MGTFFTVGEKYPLFQEGTERMLNQDGALFEAMDENEGFILGIYLNRPHPEEISLIRKETIHTRLVIENNFILPMIKFGDKPLIFEMNFDPTLYNDSRALQLSETNNMILIVTIDSSTGKIAALRHANLPLNFVQHCSQIWSRALLSTDYSAQYTNWSKGLQANSIESLWNKAIPTGSLGERYDIDEITYHPNSQHYTK